METAEIGRTMHVHQSSGNLRRSMMFRRRAEPAKRGFLTLEALVPWAKMGQNTNT